MKYPRTPHWRSSPGLSSDDIREAGTDGFVDTDLIITEKLDGSNVRLIAGEVYARGGTLPSHHGWHAMVRKHHQHKTVTFPDHAFFGEDIYGVHSIHYDPVPEDETFRCFAVLHQRQWLAWADVEHLCDQAGFLTVPVLYRGRFNEAAALDAWLAKELVRPSLLGGPREGFVIRSAGAFPDDAFGAHVRKYVRAGHVQTDQHWTKNWKPIQIIGRKAKGGL